MGDDATAARYQDPNNLHFLNVCVLLRSNTGRERSHDKLKDSFIAARMHESTIRAICDMNGNVSSTIMHVCMHACIGAGIVPKLSQ